MGKQIPIGNLIFHELKEQKRSIAWLAKNVHYSHHTMCDILKRDHLNINLLLSISKELKYDFFAHYSAFLDEQNLFIVRETNIAREEEIAIGDQICQKLKEQERSIAWLAKKVHYNYSTLYKILKQNHLDTDLLVHISDILQYDFFAHYSAFLRERLLNMEKNVIKYDENINEKLKYLT